MSRRRERADLPPEERCFDCDLPITATRVCIEVAGVRTYFHRGCHPSWEKRQRFRPGKAPAVIPLDPRDELARVLGIGQAAAIDGAAVRQQGSLPLGDREATDEPTPAERRRARRFSR